jgi:DegV family protein with EDD domain
MIKIVADSTCNLTDEIVQQYDLRIAPIAIQFGQESYEEGIDIDRDTFYRKIEEIGIIPTSSQPSPAWFAKHYEELQDSSVLVITVTRKHSGTFESAIMDGT